MLRWCEKRGKKEKRFFWGGKYEFRKKNERKNQKWKKNIYCIEKNGLMSRVFVNGPADLGSISWRVIPKTQKCYLMLPCLAHSPIRLKSRVKWSNPGNGVAPSPTSRCRSYWKGSLWVTLDQGCQLILGLFYDYTFTFFSCSYSLCCVFCMVQSNTNNTQNKFSWLYMTVTSTTTPGQNERGCNWLLCTTQLALSHILEQNRLLFLMGMWLEKL